MIRLTIILIFLLSSCAWNSDDGWFIDPGEPEPVAREYKLGECAGENEFGEFTLGGGCNIHGCWMEGGSCNEFGCSFTGVCSYTGCEKPTSSFKCMKPDL